MSEFNVHSVPGSPYGRAVLATLEEKGASYRLSRVAPQELRAEPHISRHPMGRVPVLEHAGFWLYETQAILRYLDRVLPSPPLTPTDVRAAARMDQVMNVNDWYLFQGVAAVIVFQRIVGPRVLGLPTDEEAVAAAIPRGQAVLGELGRLLGQNAFFAGASISLADMILAPQLDLLAATPEWERLTGHVANVSDWLSRVNERPSMRATTWERASEMADAA